MKKVFKKEFFLEIFFENLGQLVDGDNWDIHDGNDNVNNNDDNDAEGSDFDRDEIKLSYEKQIYSNWVGIMMRPVGIRRYIKFFMDIL